jgi:hypothetical protein
MADRTGWRLPWVIRDDNETAVVAAEALRA